MLKRIIDDSLTNIRFVLLNPTQFFKDINKYNLSIYFLFFTNCVITLFKSFNKTSYKNNYFTNQNINEIISFFNIPQIRWLIVLLSYVLFIFLIGRLCKLFFKKCNKQKLILCLLSISSVGILLHILFFIFHCFLSQQSIYFLRHIAFVWIIWISIVAIKNSQNISYMQSIMLFILSGLPAVLIIGLPGLAPYSLWLVV